MVFQEESMLGDSTVSQPEETRVPITEWQRIEADPDFQHLVKQKRGFIFPATAFFVIYYFSLLILVGYFPSLMDTKVIGAINVAYIFALSQFFMAWILAAIYIRRANGFDRLAASLIAKLKVKGGRK